MKTLITILLLWLILSSGSSQSAEFQDVSLCYELAEYAGEVAAARDRGVAVADAIKVIYRIPVQTVGISDALASIVVGVYQSNKSKKELEYFVFNYCIKEE